MLKLKLTSSFKRDLKACHKWHYNLSLLESVVNTLRIPAPLDARHKDHKLEGNFKGYRDCHVLDDWILIYRADEECLTLYRTGTHADIF